MKDKILNVVLLISFLFMICSLYLFFCPNENKKLEEALKQNYEKVKKEQNYKKRTQEKDKKRIIVKFKKKALEKNSKKTKQKTSTPTNKTKSNSTNNSTIFHFSTNKPIPLSYKSRQEIFDIRKSHVEKSPFYYEGYEPSEEVFGQIEDWKPWKSQYSCCWESTGVCKTEGPSSVSLPIINPTALVLLDYAFVPYKCEYVPEHCKFDFWPTSINYNKDKKVVRVIYKQFEHIDPSKRTYYVLNGLNAKDFGYKYAYVDINKSTFKPEFVEQRNISTEVVEFQDFIHVGGSCGVEGGCNNHSPDDPNMRIYYSKLQSKQYNKLYIKLWKERPISPEDEPDMVEILQINYM